MTADSKKQPARLPRKFSPLFWDVHIKDIDLEANEPFIMERILEFGTWGAVVWFREYYGDERIKQYILNRGYKVLSRKTLNYWKNTLPLDSKQWKKNILTKQQQANQNHRTLSLI